MKRFIGFSALALGALCVVGVELAVVPPAVAADKLFFQGDMVRGRPKSGPTGPVCVRMEKVVWRIRVFDPAKSRQLGKAGLKSMFVELPDGKKFKMRFGNHPPKKSTDTYWTAAWQIPADYPTGSFAYKVVATDKTGKAHSWQPFNNRGSQFTVIAGNTK